MIALQVLYFDKACLHNYYIYSYMCDFYFLSHCVIAMQNEHEVIRLEWQAIHVHYSYMLDEMSPDAVVPYLVERRLLSPEQAQEVNEISSRLGKVTTILQALQGKIIVGLLPTFCAALISAGLSQIAERLTESEYMHGLRLMRLSHAIKNMH